MGKTLKNIIYQNSKNPRKANALRGFLLCFESGKANFTNSNICAIIYLPASPGRKNERGGKIMLEILYALISVMNSVGAGVIANYISEKLRKWLNG